MTFAGNGNVGIGTTTPSVKLDVYGGYARIDGNTGAGRLAINTNAANDWSYVVFDQSGVDGAFVGLGGPSYGYFGGNNYLNMWNQVANGGISFGTNNGTGASQKVVIDKDGNVGIGVAPGYKLEVAGSLKIGVGAGPLFYHGLSPITVTAGDSVCANANAVGLCTSLSQYKTNVTDITDALGLIKGLRPVNYDWKDGYYNGVRGDIGFLAEDVQALDPRLAEYNTDGSLVGVRYDHMVALVVKGMQEQQLEIAGLTGTSSLVFASTTDEILTASDTNPISDVIAYITGKIEAGVRIVRELVAERIVAVSGYFKNIFTDTSHQKTLCVGEAGNETCITKDQLDALLNVQNVSPASSAPTSPAENPQPPTTEQTDNPHTDAVSDNPSDVVSSSDQVFEPAPSEPATEPDEIAPADVNPPATDISTSAPTTDTAPSIDAMPSEQEVTTPTSN